MRLLCRFLPLLFLGLSPLLAGTPEEAARIQKDYTLATEAWELKLKLATTEAAIQELVPQRPNAETYGKRMWACLQPSLDQDWTLSPASWLIRLASITPSLTPAVAEIRKAVETRHLNSPKLSPFCLALSTSREPDSRLLLEKIAAQNPDPKVQGVASLAQAILLRSIGDDTDLIKKRLTLIRKAIIDSATEEIDGASITTIAEEELYIIRNLTKGRIAPDCQGVDSGGRPLKLSTFRGKVVALVFWSNQMPDAENTLSYLNSLEQKFTGKPFTLVGVNSDPVATLRTLQARDTNRISWPNFSDPNGEVAKQFRVSSRPVICLLDAEGKIQHFGMPDSFFDLTLTALLEPKKAPTPNRSTPPPGN